MAEYTRLLIHAEGLTEKLFVEYVIRPHFEALGYHRVRARRVGDARRGKFDGGIRRWPAVETQILSGLAEDPGSIATTMVDYYGLPGRDDWVGANPHGKSSNVVCRINGIQTAMSEAIASKIGEFQSRSRFVPFIVMHEFEALLFSDCEVLANFFMQDTGQAAELATRFEEVVNSTGGSPEYIDDSKETSPSERLKSIIPRNLWYTKARNGPAIAEEIGLATIRDRCPHFNRWIERLEELAPRNSA